MAAGTVKQLRAVSDPSGLIAGVVAPSYVENQTLAASTPENMVVPAKATAVILCFDTDVYLNFNGTAATPSGDTTDGSGSIYHPAGSTRLFGVLAGSNISIVAAATAHGSGEFFG